MSDWKLGVPVPPLSIGKIRELTDTIRQTTQIAPEKYFPVVWFLEIALPSSLPGFDWIADESLPHHYEACAYPDGCAENPEGPFIKIRPDVYEAAHAGDGRARLTLLHECGHVLLHRMVAIHPRNQGSAGGELRPFENSEWQANTFAAELLMPPKSFHGSRSLQAYCKKMGVSHKAALTQGNKLSKRREIPMFPWLARTA